jgi:two-component sensor histidine kinase
MKRLIRNLSIKNQLLLVILPVVLFVVGSTSYVNYIRLNNELIQNEKITIESIKNNASHFLENYNLNVNLNKNQIQDRFEKIFPDLMSLNVDFGLINLDSLCVILNIDTALEDLKIINTIGEVVNSTYYQNNSTETKYELNASFLQNIFEQTSAVYLFEDDLNYKQSKNNQAFKTLNENYVLNIQITSDSIEILKDDLRVNLSELSKNYENILYIDLFTLNKKIETKNYHSTLLDSLRQEMLSFKKDTTLILKKDTNIIYANFIYVDNVYRGQDYLLQIISDNSLDIKLFKNESKWFLFKLIFSLGTIVLFLFFIAKIISKPLTILSTEIDQMTQAEGLSEIDLKNSSEAKSLSDKFNILTNLINNFHATLEHKIKARTKDLNQKNKKLEKLLKERDALIKEIHHRVKNNLQIVSSLLSLQSKMVDDEKAKAAFLESMNRIQAIGLLHEKLYKNSNYINVQAQTYLTDLVKIYEKTINQNINITLTVDYLVFDSSQAISIGLIINEFISNSLKHAFSDSEQGKIDISLKKTEKEAILQLKNNGKPLDKEFNPKLTNNSLGMTIIEAFTEKLDGSYEFHNIETGVELKIIFPTIQKINEEE